jgi:hypothetical protein
VASLVSIVVAAAVLTGTGRSASAQRGRGEAGMRPVVSLDALLQSTGPGWQRARSPHFLLFAERGERPRYDPRALLDSLEAAYAHASRLLGVALGAHQPVPVLVTRSRTRFSKFLAPFGKGVANVGGAPEGDFILLVHNDSVRAYVCHEVMHLVAHRAWGPAAAHWVTEGVAVWADGRCQGTSVLAVARDLLREEPGLTAADLAARFTHRLGPDAASRAREYTLAGSLVAFVAERGGRAGVQAVWRRGIPTGRALEPWGADSLAAPWRRGIPPKALARFGCG